MAQAPPRVPFAPPRWIYADTVLFAATGLVVASAVPLCLAVLCGTDSTWFHEQNPLEMLPGALLYGTLLALVVLSAGNLRAAGVVAFIGGPFAGALLGAGSAIFVPVPAWREISTTASVLSGVLSGSVLLVALAGAACIAALFRAQPAHDDFDRVLVAIGAWLLALHAAAAVPLHALGLGAVSWVGAGGGCAALGLACLRQRLRKRWFERVRAGVVAEWVLRDWHREDDIEDLIPLFGGSVLACDAVLVHVAPGEGSAYRTQGAETPVLLAPGHRGGS
jgi:hypothetical protein